MRYRHEDLVIRKFRSRDLPHCEQLLDNTCVTALTNELWLRPLPWVLILLSTWSIHCLLSLLLSQEFLLIHLLGYDLDARWTMVSGTLCCVVAYMCCWFEAWWHLSGLCTYPRTCCFPSAIADLYGYWTAYGRTVLVADLHGRIVGCVALDDYREVKTASAELKYIAVDSSYRRLGIGYRMLLQLEDFTRRSGYKSILLSAAEFETSGQLLFEKFGFKQESKQLVPMLTHNIEVFSYSKKIRQLSECIS